MIKFSKEIQGLRAIAVSSVVLFHFGIEGLKGGYLGVDIFFVISGYIIGQLILSSLEKNQFSLIDFYKNRAVRLFPNLLLMLGASVIVSWLLLKPYDFFQFGKSLQFSGVYVTNIVFSKQQGYFDISRELKPLLHTWSLSIEEQFYLFLPVVLILTKRISLKIRIGLIVGVISASLLYKAWLINSLPINSFFSFPGRVWELGLGVFFAAWPKQLKEKIQGQSIIAAISLFVLCLYLFTLDEGTPFAGITSIGCCIATGLLILSSPNTWLGQLLSTRFMGYLGAISYSLYLWHWLVLVTFKNSASNLDQVTEFFVMTLTSVLIAHLAWKYVELPLRGMKDSLSRKQVFSCVLLFTCITTASGSYIYAKGGFPERFPMHTQINKNIESFNWKQSTGHEPVNAEGCPLTKKGISQINQCTSGDLSASRTILLIGDSHAASVKSAFDIAGQKNNVKVVTAVGPGCPPLLGIKSFNGADDICEKIDFDKNLKELLSSNKFDEVYLVAYWDMYARGSRSNGRLLRPTHFISNKQTTSVSPEKSQEVLRQALSQTIQYINGQGAGVTLVQDVPTLPSPIQDLPDRHTQTIEAVKEQQLFIKQFLKSEKNLRLKEIDLSNAICTDGICHSHLNDYYLYRDNNHLSPAGAALTIPVISQSLKR